MISISKTKIKIDYRKKERKNNNNNNNNCTVMCGFQENMKAWQSLS